VTQQSTEEKVQAAESAPRRPSPLRWLIMALAALGAGLTASLCAVVLMGILRLALGIPTPVELFGDYVLKHIPVNTFIRLLLTYKSNAKTEPLGLALLGMIGAGTVLGLVYTLLAHVSYPARGYRPRRREWLAAALLAVAMTAVGIILFWNELPQNFFGLPFTWAMLVTSLALLADFSLYGVVICLAYRALLPKQKAAEARARSVQGRRQLLTRAGVTVLGLGAAGGTFGLIEDFLSYKTTYDGTETFTTNGFIAPITPNDKHYVVTQNPIDPDPNIALWRLEVTGLVANAGTYDYTALQQLPSTSRAITLECIANGVGGRLISTAIWQGVTLQTLLEKHGGPLSGAKFVSFYGVDGYNTSLPLDEVLAVDALLAWRMNGVPLPDRHGYPLRALIPGRYGEEQPKWLTRVELTDHFIGGLYSDQGWYNGPLHTISRIDRPFGNIPFSQGIEIGGIAFAGNRGIEKVEVSVDGGLTWQQAHLEPPLSQDSWVLWSYQWAPTTRGRYVIVARATDGTGALQTSHKQGTVPDGATGYPSVTVHLV
jgi:DMSO/TMAO reductase YedYZ molybdopterin-dependent catalytic subunit